MSINNADVNLKRRLLSEEHRLTINSLRKDKPPVIQITTLPPVFCDLCLPEERLEAEFLISLQVTSIKEVDLKVCWAHAENPWRDR